ncbi:MAG: ComF family protein [Lachnospiraceae bacterium]|nr:ComF family protein [Lachnospiraceae bacterium]
MIWDLLYPKRCAVCDGILTAKEHLCCAKCRGALPFIKQPCCYSCGKPLESENQEYCGDCRKNQKTFYQNRALFLYNEAIQSAMLRFKAGNRREYAEFYGEEIAKQLGGVIKGWDVDAILPVPLHSRKLKIRGYNQAELVAEVVGRQLDIPVITECLVRSVYTKAQKQLNNIERLKNLEKAFHFCKNSVKLNKVILLDDIYTTGATLEACSRVLKTGGIELVYGITIAAGQGY